MQNLPIFTQIQKKEKIYFLNIIGLHWFFVYVFWDGLYEFIKLQKNNQNREKIILTIILFVLAIFAYLKTMLTNPGHINENDFDKNENLGKNDKNLIF